MVSWISTSFASGWKSGLDLSFVFRSHHISDLSLLICCMFPYWTICPIWALRKVFLIIISSSCKSFGKPLPLNDKSLKLKLNGPRPRLQSLCSNYCSYYMKVPLISRSGLLELRNSSVFSIDHRYFLIKYAARTLELLLCPLTECTRTDSYFLIAFSIKSKIAFVVVSLRSKIIWFSRSSH